MKKIIEFWEGNVSQPAHFLFPILPCILSIIQSEPTFYPTQDQSLWAEIQEMVNGAWDHTVEKSKTFMHRDTPAVANSSSSRSNSMLQCNTLIHKYSEDLITNENSTQQTMRLHKKKKNQELRILISHILNAWQTYKDPCSYNPLSPTQLQALTICDQTFISTLSCPSNMVALFPFTKSYNFPTTWSELFYHVKD